MVRGKDCELKSRVGSHSELRWKRGVFADAGDLSARENKADGGVGIAIGIVCRPLGKENIARAKVR